jgi:large subunit ribosomal protein L4
MRREALRGALAAKIGAGELSVVETLAAPADGKTKALLTTLDGLGVKPLPTLLVVAQSAPLLLRAARNVPWLTVQTPRHVSVYELMRSSQVVVERAGLQALEEALAP